MPRPVLDKQKALDKESARLKENLRQIGQQTTNLPDDFFDDILNDSDDETENTKKKGTVAQEEQNDEVKEALKYLCEAQRDVLKDKVTVAETWEKLHILCKNPKHFALTGGVMSEQGPWEDESLLNEQLKVLESTELTKIESCLIAADPFHVVGMFAAALVEVEKEDQKGNEPSLTQCLSWLAFAAQSPVETIIPPGEFFPEVDDYITKTLFHPNLKEIEDISSRVQLASVQIGRVFEFLTRFKFEKISVIDKAILLYAVSRILIDKHTSEELYIQDLAVELFSQILASCENPMQLVWEFGQLLPNLCDDLRGHLVILNIFRSARSPCTACICLLRFIFVHISERGEWAPSEDYDLPDGEFSTKYLEAIKQMLINVLEVLKEERSQQLAVISMVDTSFHPSMIELVPKDSFQVVKAKLNLIKREWRRTGHTDDVILDNHLSSILSRLYENTPRSHNPSTDAEE